MLALIPERHARRLGHAAALLCTALLLCLALPGEQSPAQARGRGLDTIRTVVIDPGHGGDNDGARGHRGSMEKDLTLQVAYAVRDRLKTDYPELNVILTRSLDVDLSLPERIHMAHVNEADLFLSLHMNSSTNKAASGLEVFYLQTDKTMPMVTRGEGSWGQKFADPDEGVDPDAHRHKAHGGELPIILADLDRARSHRDSALLASTLLDELRRVCTACRNRGVRQANFGVLRGSRVPSVVVEFGFLSNPGEERRLTHGETHKSFARAISRTIDHMDLVFTDREY